MANKTISSLPELLVPSSGDIIPIVSSSETKKITVGNLIGDKYVRTTRFAIISSGTSGTITLPPDSEVVLDDFGGTVDAVVSTVSGGFPTTIPAKTGEIIVATTFTGLGAWSLSSTPDSYPVAIIYRVRQKLLDFDSTASNIWGPSNIEVVTKADIGLGNVDNTADLDKPISNPTIDYILAEHELVKEPTGFVNRTDSLLSFNNSSREFTITAASGTFDIYVKGNKYVKETKTLRISEESGNHFIYYDVDGILSETTSFDPSLFEDNALVSIVYWNNDTLKYSYLADERHGLVMDGATHSYLHTVFGARYLSGLALQNFFPDGSGDLAKEAKFEADIGKIRDEDLLIELPITVEFPVLYRLAENGLWRKKIANEFPVIYNGEEGYSSDGTIAYNEFDGTSWRLTPVGDGDFVLMHIFATNDYETPFVVILGINKYPNTPAARAAADSEISSLSGLPFAEFVAVGTVIFQTDAAYTNTPKARIVSAALGETYVDFRGEQLYTPSGVATSHSLLSNLGSDDHTQYYNEVRGDARYIKQVDDKSFYRISYQKDYFLIQAVSALTAPSVTGGVAVSATGTATAVTTTAASFYTYKKLLSYTASSGSTAIAGWRVIPRTYIHGNTYGGFKFSCGFGFHAGMASGGINRRMFVGFQSSGVAPTDIEPSTVTSCFFFGLDNGDVNIQFMHNDGAGTCTKIDTGLPRPTADQVDFYCVEFLSVAGSSVLNYKIINELNGTMFSGSVSTNLPSNTTALAPRAWLSAGGVASAVAISMNHIYIET